MFTNLKHTVFIQIHNYFTVAKLRFGLLVPGDPKKYSCLIKHKMHNKRGIFKNKIVLNYQ